MSQPAGHTTAGVSGRAYAYGSASLGWHGPRERRVREHGARAHAVTKERVAMTFERVWEAEPEAVAEIRHAVLSFFEQAVEIPAMRRHDIALVVTEAASNAVVHAFPEDDGDGSLHVLAEIDGPRLRVILTDNGVGMTVRDERPGLGLGLPLMAHISDDIHFSAVEGGGTRVSFEFHVADATEVNTYERACS